MTLHERIAEKINGQLKGSTNEQAIANLATMLEADIKFIGVSFASYAIQNPELETNLLFDEWFENHFNDPIIKTFE
ncbi:hypothetical protein ACFQ3S_17835 [Mucilaginibacter terrae]|uniref:hypothetical protein n=1 Tax=Mucilaginibacter terrae TaxID=1955052 RepID=UPI003643BD00